MKKLLLILCVLLISNAFCYEDILNNGKIYYSSFNNTFSKTRLEDNSILLRKKAPSKTEKYTKYYDENGNIVLNPKTDYEFLANNRLIGYNNDELKFYEITKNKMKLLSNEQVKELFPEYELILISQFDKNKKYLIKNSIFKSKKVLVLNDTNRDFHKFTVYPISSRNEISKGQQFGLVKSLITIYGKKNVRLKHPGGDEFEITIK